MSLGSVDLLGLYRTLTAVVDVPDELDRWWAGPRWWWGGRLDVEGLALGSVGTVIAALTAFTQTTRDAYSTRSALVAASFNSLAHLRIAGGVPGQWAQMSGFFPTRDGWVRLHANYPHHAQRLMSALAVETSDGVRAALRERSALEVEEAVQAAGGVAAAVRTPAQWRSTTMGACASNLPWIDFTLRETGRERSRETRGSTLRRPLDGITVLDFTRVIAGPSATRLLAALGCDVLRIDPPHLPELTSQHIDTGFGKRSACVDLRDPADLTHVRELIRTADVVVLGYRPRSLSRFGLDPDSLLDEHPGLVVVSVDAWGSGPWEQRRGFDSIVQAAAGIAHLYGTEKDGAWQPGALPLQALDHATGMGMAAAAIALLAARGRGVAGSARLSLAATAHLLMTSPSPPGDVVPVELPVSLGACDSPYGELEFVRPPLRVAGRWLEYPQAPVLYGSSRLAWC